MIGQIDGYYIAAEVRLLRQLHKGTILLVEGQTDDRVLDRFVNPAECEIEIGFGKKNVIEALDRLEDEGFPGVVAVVDADFDRVLNIKYGLEGLCVTDHHDLDLVIFASTALDRFVAERADADLFEKELGSKVNLLRDRIIEAALPFSYARLASERRGLNLYFGDFEHENYVDDATLSVDLEAMANDLIARSKTTCAKEQLTKFINGEKASPPDKYDVTNGHDVAAILGIALRKWIGNRRKQQTWASEVEAGLRLAFDWEAMAQTRVRACLEGWANDNPPYRVFRL